ncbi:uncharacterized protein SPPG_09386 [Spizellomyces punctatus DAOM BR117]|uniref:NADH dehydrogenase [ubiquinone] 1 alpha subcomplex subunit 4 n=1 Tax=Spizellomyces punctatus (strain DAOM BR117) TaxID=645134 RepID=A0A0L0H989_SPIPD|nr:uncharacterized protein SPPG_09386 [Spizellomyces punctatus DAOM BR117]KNC98080.1 hypothetical protein SPPG_09386 [Spizellomyces punctatus DAOM BR117]|eukprot:XP_016606120.1 hypothetical protein SPPG_09386 [Spizellomyces punctatus DAOM BR117]
MAGGLLKIPFGVYPLVAVMGGAVVGVGYFLAHKSVSPDVVWSRSKNPQPWNTVSQHETTKIYDPTGQYKKWNRFSSDKNSGKVEH